MHAGVVEDLAVQEIVVGLHVTGQDQQNVVAVAGNRIGFHDFGQCLYVVFELLMLRQVGQAIQTERPLSPALARSQLVIECLFPVAAEKNGD